MDKNKQPEHTKLQFTQTLSFDIMNPETPENPETL